MAFTITSGVIAAGQKVVIYGPEGIGKTSLAARFPRPVFIDTEGSTRNFDVARLPAPTSWELLKSEVQWAAESPSGLGTLVIDTADWADKLCARSVCQRAGKTGIEDFGYGKGYVYEAEEFGRLLDLLDRVSAQGVHVVLTAHSNLRKVELPDNMGAYDKYELKLSKQCSPLVKEWADLLLFCNYKTIVVQTEGGKGKAQGGKRVMYTAHHPCWDAKNRHGLPDELPMDYSALAHLFSAPPAPPAEETQENPTPAATGEGQAAPATGTRRTARHASSAEPAPAPAPVPAQPDELEGIYPPLAELMRADGVSPWELTLCVNDRQKGVFPADMEPKNYPLDFVTGWVMPYWQQVADWVRKDREDLPF